MASTMDLINPHGSPFHWFLTSPLYKPSPNSLLRLVELTVYQSRSSYDLYK